MKSTPVPVQVRDGHHGAAYRSERACLHSFCHSDIRDKRKYVFVHLITSYSKPRCRRRPPEQTRLHMHTVAFSFHPKFCNSFIAFNLLINFGVLCSYDFIEYSGFKLKAGIILLEGLIFFILWNVYCDCMHATVCEMLDVQTKTNGTHM